jgi:hypothetical protein
MISGRVRAVVALLAAAALLGSMFRLTVFRPEPLDPLPPLPPLPSVSADPSSSGRPSSGSDPRKGPLADLPSNIRSIAQQVERVRGLRFVEPFTVKVVTRARMAQMIEEQIDQDVDRAEVEADALALRHLGLLAADADLTEILRNFYSGVIAGFYRPEDKHFFVTTEGGGLSQAGRFYAAHELAHALVDQHFELSLLEELYEDRETFDAGLAMQALSEGDADITAVRWMRRFMTNAERRQMLRDFENEDFDADAPEFLMDSTSFPYEMGEIFVGELLERGGWGAVNDAYRNPPTTSEQIYDPDRYLAREQALSVGAFARLEGITRVAVGAFGMFDLVTTIDGDAQLGTGLSEEIAMKVGEGWGGGRYETVRSGAGSAIVVRLIFDDGNEAREAQEALDDWLAARIPGGTDRVIPGGVNRTGPKVVGSFFREAAQVGLVVGDHGGLVQRLLERERVAAARAA